MRLPKDASGAGMPSPTKERKDSMKMALGMVIMVITMTELNRLGKISRNKMVRVPVPSTLEACTCSLSFKRRVLARTRRLIPSQPDMDMATIMDRSPGDIATTKRETMTIMGIPFMISTIRCIIRSVFPP